MSLKENIQADLKEAVKGKKELEVLVWRMFKAAVLNKEKEKRYKLNKEKPDLAEDKLVKESELREEELLDLISSEVKKRRESVSEYEKGGRPELAEKEKKEIEILSKYLPEQMPEEDIRKLVESAIKKLGAKDQKEMGRVMSELMPVVKGKADGSLVSRIVKELLTSQK
ncbi:MAG: GatB/YqeY domain-containing protein [Candidatus Nealsonbacteria bacterium]